MKKLYLAFGLLIGTSFLYSQKVWDGGGTGVTQFNFTNPQNWVGDLAPVAGDDIIFDGTSSKNCFINTATIFNNLTITSGYGGTLTSNTQIKTFTGSVVMSGGTYSCHTGALTMGTFSLGGGVFIGVGGSILVTGDMTIDGGTFTSSSANLTLRGDFTLGGSGVFNHNNGNVTLDVDNIASTSISGSPVFNNLIISDLGGGGDYIVDFGTSTTNNLITDIGGGSNSAVWNFQGNLSILSSLTLEGINTSAPTANSGVFTFSGVGPITIDAATAGIGAGANRLPNVVMNTSGTIDMLGDISVSGNWTHVDGDLTIGNASTVHFYGSSATISDSSRFESLSVESGASVTFPAGGTFKVAGDFNNSGTFNPPPTSCMLLNGDGSSPQNINGSSFAIGKIEAADGIKTIEFNTSVRILDVITLGDNVTLDANVGNLTLNAANGGTKARIAPLGSGASIAGTINVENFIPGGSPGWANLGTAGVSGLTVVDWDGQIPITCTGCTYDSTAITPPFTSVWQWDELTESYQFGLGSTPLTPGKGFYVYVASNLITANDYTLVYTGSAVTGNVNVTINIATSPFSAFTSNLISNPYASPIEWDNVYASNGSSSDLGSIYAWNAQANAYSVYTPGSGASGAAGFGANGLMPAGQAFFLDADISGFSFPMPLTFSETDKSTSNSSEVFKSQNYSNSVKFKLFLTCPGEEVQNTLLHFNPQATENFDNYYDARHIFSTPGYMGYPGSYSKYNSISTHWGGRDYAINTLPDLTKTYTVPVLVKVAVSGTHTISAGEFQNFNACMVLHDKLNDNYHNLMQSAYVCQINDTTSTPRFEIIICESGITNPNTIEELNTSNTIFITQDGNGAVVNTKFESETKAEISVYNLLGQKLMNDFHIQGTETSTRLPIDASNQVIFVKVSTNKEVVTKKLVLGQ